MANQAREYIRVHNAIPSLIKYLYVKENNWSLLQACIGLIRNLALLKTNLSILCEYRTVYKIGQLFFQMKMISERNELFLTTLVVFCKQEEQFQKIIYEQIINSSCVETLAQVRRKLEIFFD